MRAEEKKLLLDAQEAGQSIHQRCAGHSFEEYAADRWFRRTEMPGSESSRGA
jgi:hypothetical protein